MVTNILFLGSKISVDGVCSHEIKRCLLLGKKAVTNLASVLKSRDVTSLKKVHIIKAMFFPIVMYGCEIWTTKKAKHQRIDAFELWCWTLESPSRLQRHHRSILKEINPAYSLEGLMPKLKLQSFDLLMLRANLL